MEAIALVDVIKSSIRNINYLEKIVDDFEKEKLELLTIIDKLKDRLNTIPEECFENPSRLTYIMQTYDMLENGNFTQKAEALFRIVFSALKP